MTATEYVILVDDDDQEIGTAQKLYAHEEGLLLSKNKSDGR